MGNSTYPDNTKLGQRGVLVLDGLDVGWHFADNIRRREFAKESTELVLLLRSVGGVPRVREEGSVRSVLLSYRLSFSGCCSSARGQTQNVPLNGSRASLEPIWNENLVFVLRVAVSQDVRTLKGLLKVAEDVVDDQNGLGGIRRTGDVYAAKIRVSVRGAETTHTFLARDANRIGSWSKQTYMSCSHQYLRRCLWPCSPLLQQGGHCSRACCGLRWRA